MLHNFLSGIRALFQRDRRNAEIQDELSSFLEASVSQKIRSGLSPSDALRAARAEIGSNESVRHQVWSANWESVADSLWQDFRYGVRQILKSPGFSLVAVLSLALGIGANTAIFTLINDLLLRQLPVRNPQQLLSFGDGTDSGTVESSDPGPYDIFPWEFYRRIASQQDQFQGITAFASFSTLISVRSGAAAGPATQANTHLVSGTFFSVLGAEPELGRTFTAADSAVDGRSPVAVISHRYWQQSLASDPSVIGRTLTINGTPFTVIGVMPPQFYGVDLETDAPDMWLPITMQHEVMLQPSLLTPTGLFWIHIMARRSPGVSVAQAQSWVTTQFQQFLVDRAGGHPNDARRKAIAGTYIPLLPGGSGLSDLRSQYQRPLEVLMGMVGIVLLIACANLANLLLAKAGAREREFSTRLALGSSRSRIMRQILTETLILAFTGGALGLALAFLLTRILISFVSGAAGHSALSATPDLTVLAFTSAVCVFTGLLFGIAPALRGSRAGVAGALNATTRNAVSAGGRKSRILPATLVVAQVTLSLLLLSVAGLLLRSLHNLRSQDLGFNKTNVLLIRTNPKFAVYQPTQLNALYQRILDRLDALPGVRSSAISGAPPMSRGTWGSPITITGRPLTPSEDIGVALNRVSTGYFETLGIPLLRGRTIGAQDTASSQRSIVVNQTFANFFFPRGDAIGHTINIADPGAGDGWQIVGIVRDSKRKSPADEPRPCAWIAVTQLTGDDQYAYTLQIQTAGDPAKITSAVRGALAEIDPNLPILDVSTLSESVDHLLDQEKFVSQLSGYFSLLALSLACIGLYGVMTWSVVRRTSEIGIRMALGAARPNVLWMVLKESLVLLVIGIVIGVPLSLAASRLIRAGLFGVSPTDPSTFIASALIIAAVIVAAAWLPARKATRIDPMVALRYE
jgi:predicted permease